MFGSTFLGQSTNKLGNSWRENIWKENLFGLDDLFSIGCYDHIFETSILHQLVIGAETR